MTCGAHGACVHGRVVCASEILMGAWAHMRIYACAYVFEGQFLTCIGECSLNCWGKVNQYQLLPQLLLLLELQHEFALVVSYLYFQLNPLQYSFYTQALN